jgi:predicted dehydrogenase
VSEPIPIAVAGVGAFGERHVAAWARTPGVRLVAVADADAARARAVAERWGVERWFDDPVRMVDACRPAGLSVVTPGPHHLEPALAALERGCAVLVEKPVTMSSGEAAELLAAEARSSAFVMPAHILRFADPYRALRERVRGGAIGEPLAISAARERSRSHATLFPGVHPALMTMVHDLDLALWIGGGRAVTVSARARGGSEAAPAVVWAQAETDAGLLWSIRTSWVLPDEAAIADRLEVYGTAGVATAVLEPTVRVLSSPPEAVDHELTPDAVLGALDAEVRHFRDRIAGRAAEPAVTLEEAAHGIAIAEAIARSARAGGAQEPVEA